MSELWIYHVVEFLFAYWMHSSLFIGTALIAVKLKFIHADKYGEWILKIVLVGGIFTALIVVSQSSLLQQSRQFLTSGFERVSTIINQTNSQSKHKDNLVPSYQKAQIVDKAENLNFINTQANEVDVKPAASNDKFKIELTELSIWIFYFWASGIFYLLLYRLVQFYRLSQLLSDRVEVVDTHLSNMLSELLHKSHSKIQVKIFESACIQSPLVFKRNEIVIPANFSKDFNEHQIEAALAHELAHLNRQDTFWLKIGLIVEVFFFIQPLNKLLNKVIHQFAEQRSDQLASQWTNNPRALAEALAVSAHNRIISSQNNMVLAMKSDNSNLLVRVEQLLGKCRNKTHRLNIVFGAAFSVLAIMLTPGMSIQTVSADAKKISKGSHTHIVNGDTTHLSMSHHSDGRKIRIEGKLEGNFTVNDDETTIVDFPKDSHLEISYDDGDIERSIKISRDSGDIEYQYFYDGDKKSYDDEAQQWFASIIPEIFRVTGLNAKQRVSRIKKTCSQQRRFRRSWLYKKRFLWLPPI